VRARRLADMLPARGGYIATGQAAVWDRISEPRRARHVYEPTAVGKNAAASGNPAAGAQLLTQATTRYGRVWQPHCQPARSAQPGTGGTDHRQGPAPGGSIGTGLARARPHLRGAQARHVYERTAVGKNAPTSGNPAAGAQRPTQATSRCGRVWKPHCPAARSAQPGAGGTDHRHVQAQGGSIGTGRGEG
jgi:hypothetical protein